MKKSWIIIAGLVLILASSCNRKAFEKKLSGEWMLTKYLYAGKDETTKRMDTTMNMYRLTFNEEQTYSEYWQSLVYSADTIIVPDTIRYDDVNMVYIIEFDTVARINKTATPHFNSGKWDLLNSESDIQLKDSVDNVRIFRILTLDRNTLNLRNGNEEIYLKK